MANSYICELLCPSHPYNCPPYCYPRPGFSYPAPPPHPHPPPLPPPPPPAPPLPYGRPNQSIIIVVSLLAGVFLLVGIASVLTKQRDRNTSTTSANPTDNTTHQHHTRGDVGGSVGLEESVINSITVCKYKKGGDHFQGGECSICLGEFQEDENLRLLPNCIHPFHLPCIDTWLKSNVNCPLCRTNVIFDPMTSLSIGPVSSSSSSSSSSNSQDVHQNRVVPDRQGNNGVGGNQSSVTIDASVLEDSSSPSVDSILQLNGEMGRGGMATDDVELVRNRMSVSMDSSASMIPKQLPQL